MTAHACAALPRGRESAEGVASAEDRQSAGDFRSALLEVLGTHCPTAAVSTRSTIQELRRRLPDLKVADEDLANIVADCAIGLGLSVTFDSREG